MSFHINLFIVDCCHAGLTGSTHRHTHRDAPLRRVLRSQLIVLPYWTLLSSLLKSLRRDNQPFTTWQTTPRWGAGWATLVWLLFFFFFLNNHHGQCYRSHAVFHLPPYYALYYFPCKKVRGCPRKMQMIVRLPQDLQRIYHCICQVFFWWVVEIFLTEWWTNTQNLNLTAWGHTETKSFNCHFLDEHPKKQFNIVEDTDQKAYRSRGTQICQQ